MCKIYKYWEHLNRYFRAIYIIENIFKFTLKKKKKRGKKKQTWRVKACPKAIQARWFNFNIDKTIIGGKNIEEKIIVFFIKKQ